MVVYPNFGRVSGFSINFLFGFLVPFKSGVAVIAKRPLKVLVLKCACGGFSLVCSLFFVALCEGRHKIMMPGGRGNCVCCTLNDFEL